MLTVLRHPMYAKLFAAQVIALVGTGLLTVALGLLAFDVAGAAAGSVRAGGLVVVAGTVLAVVMTAAVTSTGTGWAWLSATWVLLGAGTSLISTPSARLLAEASTASDRNLVYTAQFALSHVCFLTRQP